MSSIHVQLTDIKSGENVIEKHTQTHPGNQRNTTIGRIVNQMNRRHSRIHQNSNGIRQFATDQATFCVIAISARLSLRMETNKKNNTRNTYSFLHLFPRNGGAHKLVVSIRVV